MNISGTGDLISEVKQFSAKTGSFAFYGDFGGGTLSIEASFDGGTIWIPLKNDGELFTITENEIHIISIGRCILRFKLDGATDADLNITIG